MRVISIVNLKGGVGKTTTAVNMAYELAVTHGHRVLLIDADHQGNASRFYGINAEGEGLISLFTHTCSVYLDVIRNTKYRNLDIIPADMALLRADLEAVAASHQNVNLLTDLCAEMARKHRYDDIVIDCPPAFTAASVSAIVASTHIVIPIKLDAYAIEGMGELVDQIQGLRSVSAAPKIAGALITMWRNTDVVLQGEAWLRKYHPCPVFDTHIRRTDVVDKSTFWRRPLAECSPRSAATADYAAFVDEFMRKERRNGETV